ncbi:Nif3-like dinuclear metal center hexameric protein [Aurantibacter crassamenti]|uniref:Nif3-like dinuclear metal center hexameric protein n=1 Tax=Aurantibacter crassamenti TaxID=1837375 RepID=UPI00193AB975|nr:Nif3-like dinuclear metal center hexameric protein [Aurantibacter crassamenti]MBM1107590.1 Nif3-like dinuclear metal center hexameric protein [Aurantibacter crassamenti]
MYVRFLLILSCILPMLAVGQNTSSITAEQLIETIIEQTGAKKISNTVDVIKAGNADTKVTGIVTCMFATMDVLKKAAEKKCNLIITHEPLFYNHIDSSEKFEDDVVYLAKKKFIDDNNLVVWRFHDYIHRIQPDGIMSGMVNKLGWQTNQSSKNPYKFSFQETTLSAFLKSIKKVFPENAFQVVGDSTMNLTNVVLVPGASGSMAQIGQLRKSDVDVVIAGEVPQWETYEYVRDANLQGRKKAILFIGHINSEESGMNFCADWLSEFINDIPIHFIACGSSYWSY